jgi:glycosyl transferase family 25
MKWKSKMRSFVINLKRSPERLVRFQEHAARHGWDVEVFPAVDKHDLLVRTLVGNKAEISHVGEPEHQLSAVAAADGKLSIDTGNWACLLSHRALWRRLLASGEEAWIVCEDDAVIEAAWEGWRIPAPAHFVFFHDRVDSAGELPEVICGGHKRNRPLALRALMPGCGTECYWVSREGAKIGLKATDPVCMPIDWQLFSYGHGPVAQGTGRSGDRIRRRLVCQIYAADKVLARHRDGGVSYINDTGAGGPGRAAPVLKPGSKHQGDWPQTTAVWPEPGGSGAENGSAPRVLCYTVALDQPGETWHRQQAHLLVASLLKTGFEGDIKVFHNGAQEIFSWPRRGVEEIRVDLPEGGRHQCYAAKFRARHLLEVAGYDYVLFLDSDCLAMGSIAHWFQGSRDILYAVEPGMPVQLKQFSGYLNDREMQRLSRNGINSGTILVKAAKYGAVMKQWERLDGRSPLREKAGADQPAWNRLILDTRLDARPLPAGEVGFGFQKLELLQLMRSPLIHFAGYGAEEKNALMLAAYTARFHSGPESRFMELLEG